LVPGLQACGQEREPERVEAARDTDACPRAAIGCEVVLERCDLRAVREGARVDQICDVRENRVLQVLVRGREIEKGDAHGVAGQPRAHTAFNLQAGLFRVDSAFEGDENHHLWFVYREPWRIDLRRSTNMV